jgi:hypothetical protein
MIQYGLSGYIRGDNGPEFIATKVHTMAARQPDQGDLY